MPTKKVISYMPNSDTSCSVLVKTEASLWIRKKGDCF